MIKVENINGHPAIHGLRCTYETKGVREIVEFLFDSYGEFILPPSFGYTIITSADRPSVAKICVREDRTLKLMLGKQTFTKEDMRKAYSAGSDKTTWFETDMVGSNPIKLPNFDKWLKNNYSS